MPQLGGGQTQYNASAELWLDQVKNIFDSPDRMWQVSKKVCIYRVPESVMISNPGAYAPLAVSFGLYHHNNNPELSRMDQHKLEAVWRVLKVLNIDKARLIAEIQKLESEIKECYEEPIQLDGEALSWKLAMDACFILEFFRSSAIKRKESDSDSFSLVFQRANAKNSRFYTIADDIIKLENQIPLFILIKILELQYGTREHATRELAAMLSKLSVFRGFPFRLFSRKDAESKLKEYMMNEQPPYHLLDLYRMVIKDLLANFSAESATPLKRDGYGGTQSNDHGRRGRSMNVAIPGSMQRLSCIDILPCLYPTPSLDESRSTPSAESLHKAGIKFQPGQLRFKKRRFGISTLFLPQITMSNSTDTRLRNLMAYEECQSCSWFPEDTVISHFVSLLDDLIDSEKDVSVLRKSLVIESFLGSDEKIARMLNSICDGITIGSIQKIEEVMKEAREHYNSRWKVWMSQFKDEHCSKPWYILSLVAAILILGMTAVQAVYSVNK